MTDPIRFNIVTAEPEVKAERPPVDVRLIKNFAGDILFQYRGTPGGWLNLVSLNNNRGTIIRERSADDDGTSGLQFDEKGRIRLEGE